MTTVIEATTRSVPPAPVEAAPRRKWRNVRHALVIAKRNLIVTIRTPEQFLDVTVQPVIFLLLFVYVFGGAIGHGSRHDYLEYLLPGMLAQGIAMGSIALGQNLNADIQKGVFDRFRSLPIARSTPLVGAVVADFFRYLTVTVIYISFGMVMGFRIHHGVVALLAAIAFAIAFALCFVWVSVWVGMKVRSPGAVQGVMFLMIFPLAFGSNAYVQVSTMPGWLQAFAKANPLSHVSSVVRGLLVDGPVAMPALWSVCWMAGLVTVFAPMAVRAYRTRA
jgi:oleandomycin transport system permease protein